MKVACVVYYAFLGVLRYLNKACVFFFCAKYFNKKNKTVLITSISILLSRTRENLTISKSRCDKSRT